MAPRAAESASAISRGSGGRPQAKAGLDHNGHESDSTRRHRHRPLNRHKAPVLAGQCLRGRRAWPTQTSSFAKRGRTDEPGLVSGRREKAETRPTDDKTGRTRIRTGHEQGERGELWAEGWRRDETPLLCGWSLAEGSWQKAGRTRPHTWQAPVPGATSSLPFSTTTTTSSAAHVQVQTTEAHL